LTIVEDTTLSVTGVKRDYYEVLGIDRNADDAAIKKAYRTLAMKYHPDRNPGDSQAVEHMKEINEAYAVLSDPQKRRLYDQYGHAGLEGYSQEDIIRSVDFSSLFREFGLRDLFGFGDSIFGSFFDRASTTRAESAKGADLRYDLTVTLEEVASGAERIVDIPVTEECPGCNGTGAQLGGLVRCGACGGTGQIVRQQRSGYAVIHRITVCARCGGKKQTVEKPCLQCHGKGTIRRTKEVRVKIPAGADTGYAIRVPGGGERGRSIPGDLYVVLNVGKHPVFERQGDDIFLRQDIPLTTAALGGKVKVPGLYRTLELDIPGGTQSGSVFRIPHAGIPHLGRHGKGDEYVVVRVLTPTNLSRRERELLSEFEKLRERLNNKD
jgi:molecular chaperone DnaJ